MNGGTPRNAVDQQILFSFLFMLRMMFFPLNVEHCTHSFITFMFYVSNIVLNDTVVDWHLEPIWHICMPLSAALTCTDNSLLLIHVQFFLPFDKYSEVFVCCQVFVHLVV